MRIEEDLSNNVIRKILKKKLFFFQENSPGQISFRLKNDIKTIVSYWEIVVASMPFQLIMSLSFIIMIKWNIVLTIIVTLLIIIQSNIIVVFKPYIFKASKQIKSISENLSGFVVDIFTRISIVKSYSGENYERRKYIQLFKDYVSASLKIKIITQVSSEVISIIGNSWSFFIIWFGGRQVMEGEMTIGELLGFLMYASMLANPINYLTTFMLSLQSVKVSYKRLFDYMNYPEENYGHINDNKTLCGLNTTIKNYNNKPILTIQNLSFKYDDKNSLISNLSCSFPSRGLTLLFGSSGSGKSTLCKLLVRKLNFCKGEINFFGFDIRTIPVNTIRSYIIYQDQNSFTFSDTIYENITYGKKNFSKEDIDNSIRLSSSNFIYGFPHQLKSNFAQSNFSVSCGQAQRIAIARAILRQSKILILDEPTSSIDAKNEQVIFSSLRELKKYQCIIMVTHNERAKNIADNVIQLSE